MTAQVGRNMFSLALSRIISGVLLFFVYVRLVTFLGPFDWGRFSLVVAYYTIFSLLIDLGIARYVIKKVSESKDLAGIYLGNFLVAQGLLSLVVMLIFLILPRVLGYDSEVSSAMMIAGLGLFLYSLSIPFSAIIQAWQKIHLVALVNFLNAILHAGWVICAIILRQNLLAIFGFYVLIGLVDVFLYLVMARRLSVPRFELRFPLLRNMIFFGIPFAFISGFEMLIAKIDVVIQKFFLPFAEIGYYSAAYRFLDFLTFIPAVIAVSLFPFISEFKDLRVREVSSVFNRLVRYSAIFALPIGIGGSMLASSIILTLFDAGYQKAIIPFQILIWATVLTIIYSVPNVIVLVKKTRAAVVTLGVATILNVIGNWILVPRFGILASAWLTVVSYLLVGAIYFAMSWKIADFSFARFLPRPIFAAALMGLALFQMREFNLVLNIISGAVIYFGILILVRAIDRDDLLYLKNIFVRKILPE